MRLKTVKIPVFFERLIDTIAQEEGIPSPVVNWCKRKSVYSAGNAWAGAMTIRAGSDKKDTKEIVLHEMTHIIQCEAGASTSRAHAPEFYAKLFTLAKRHGVGAAYIKSRESWYKPRGVKEGYRLYLKQLRLTAP